MSLIAPTHIEAEAHLVQTCLEYPERMANAHVTPAEFISPLYRTAWQVMRERELAGAPIDSIIVAEFMREAGVEMSGAELMATGAAASDGVVEVMSQRIREAHVSRSVASACSQVVTDIKGGKRGSDALSDALMALSALEVEQPMEAVTASELVREEIQALGELIAARERGESPDIGIPTGLENLDEKIGGLQTGVCTVVGARPGMGKSAFAIAVTDGATKAGHGVHFFSLEDTRKAYSQRLLARCSKIAVESLKTGALNRGDLDNLKRGHAAYQNRKWLIDDRSGITAEEIVRSVRKCKRKNGTRLVIVDYLQLLKGSSIGPRHERLGHSIQVLADAAKQDGMSYMVLSQLNRGLESRDNKRPQCSDLKESGDIEDKAKCILFLYRGTVYGEHGSANDRVEILIGKNNQGESGVRVEANWDPKTIRIF